MNPSKDMRTDENELITHMAKNKTVTSLVLTHCSLILVDILEGCAPYFCLLRGDAKMTEDKTRKTRAPMTTTYRTTSTNTRSINQVLCITVGLCFEEAFSLHLSRSNAMGKLVGSYF
jgi:hypothetical protein